jgi:hypothetical protein
VNDGVPGVACSRADSALVAAAARLARAPAAAHR